MNEVKSGRVRRKEERRGMNRRECLWHNIGSKYRCRSYAHQGPLREHLISQTMYLTVHAGMTDRSQCQWRIQDLQRMAPRYDYCTVLYCAVLYCTVLYCTVPTLFLYFLTCFSFLIMFVSAICVNYC